MKYQTMKYKICSERVNLQPLNINLLAIIPCVNCMCSCWIYLQNTSGLKYVRPKKVVRVTIKLFLNYITVARSKAWVCGRSLAEIVGSNPAEGIDVCLCCVLSGRRLCDGLITRPEESYRPWRVVVCDLENSWMRRTWPTGGCRVRNKQTN